MGLRFRQIFRVLPGLRLNLSKSGISTSLGVRGATVNLSRKGIRGTAGIPGSGVSYSKMLLHSPRRVPSPASQTSNSESSLIQADHDAATSLSADEASKNAMSNLYLLTAHLVVGQANASTSWLQRKLRISYNDAVELITQLEIDGVVSPPNGIGRRKILASIHDLPDLPSNEPDGEALIDRFGLNVVDQTNKSS